MELIKDKFGFVLSEGDPVCYVVGSSYSSSGEFRFAKIIGFNLDKKTVYTKNICKNYNARKSEHSGSELILLLGPPEAYKDFIQ